MPGKLPTKLYGQVARDFHVSEVPNVPLADLGFGRGFVIGSAICACVLVGGAVNVFLAKDAVAVARGLGFMLMAFGGTFIFGMVYQVVTGKGIPWSVSLPNYSRMGVLTPKQNPVGFWLTIAASMLLFSAMVAVGAYGSLYPAIAAGLLR